MQPKFVLKLLTLGDSNVGKSCLALRFMGQKFDDHPFPTIAIDFKAKIINFNNTPIKVLIWDTAGQEKYQSMAKTYYNGANGIMLVFDISAKKSFDRIEFWLKELEENERFENLFIVLVGNKVDLNNNREVSFEEADNYAKQHNINYYEVSAKTNQGVDQMFDDLINGATKKLFSNTSKNEGNNQVLDYLEEEKKNKKNEQRDKCC